MSDAITDIGRDRKRSEGIVKYLNGVASYLKGNLSLAKVKERAAGASGGPRGYFTGPVDLVADLDKTLKKLKQKDKQTWARFMCQFWIHLRLYQLSPWYGKVLLYVDYEDSSASIKSYPSGLILETTVNKLIKDKGWIVYDRDDYLVVIDKLKIENTILSVDGTEVYWIGNDTRFRCSDDEFRYLIKPRKANEWFGHGTPVQRDEYCGLKT